MYIDPPFTWLRRFQIRLHYHKEDDVDVHNESSANLYLVFIHAEKILKAKNPHGLVTTGINESSSLVP